MAMTWGRGVLMVPIGTWGRRRGRKVSEKITGRESVEADISGPFAIHKPTAGRAGISGYEVAHVPTGRVLCYGATSKKAARQFCAEIADLADWSAVQPGTCPPEIKAPLLSAIRRAQGW